MSPHPQLGPRDDNDHRTFGKPQAIGIAVALGSGILVALFYSWRVHRRRQKLRKLGIPVKLTVTPANAGGIGGGDSGGQGGYASSAEQGHSLLGNAKGPATGESGHVGNGEFQYPPPTAQLPPPRYEEALSKAPRPPGEAASYFNGAAMMGEDEGGRGRSRERDSLPVGGRGRGLSVDTRSVHSVQRSRSGSRFREEGMVDVGLTPNR